MWLAGNEADIKLCGNNSYIYVSGAIATIGNSGLTILGSGSTLELSKTSGGWKIKANNHSLEASADGLYYDGSKIG